MKEFEYKMPAKVRFGVGITNNLGRILREELGFQKAFIATDKGIAAAGILEKITNSLDGDGFPYQVYDALIPDPTIEVVDEAADVLRNSGADVVVAVGGGSPIDTAKAMCMLQTHEGSVRDYLFGGTKQVENPILPLICIPTTAGTGSEMTAASVITNNQEQTKVSVTHENLIPKMALIDPSLHVGMPPFITATTGMDALTHAIEAYVSTAASSYSDALAMKAIEMVCAYLPSSYKGNKESRAHMHDAQCLAGMAFSNALLGIVHSMAHKTGAAFHEGAMANQHLPHGCANAIYLPYVIQYNAHDQRAAERYADIARMLGLSGRSDKALIESLCTLIGNMNTAMNIPHTLKEFGVDEKEFLAKVDEIAVNAVGDACTGSNPRTITPEVMAKLLKCAYYGTEVDF